MATFQGNSTAMNPVTLKLQKGTTKAAPLVVNDWLFVHVAFYCLCLIWVQSPMFSNHVRDQKARECWPQSKTVDSKGQSGSSGPPIAHRFLLYAVFFCIWHKMDPRTLLIPCWSVWVTCVCDHSLFPSMWVRELVSDPIEGMGVWRAECLTGNVKRFERSEIMRKG